MVDLTPVFMSDVPQISAVLRGFVFAPDRSSWAEIKGFKDNVEIQVAATYASAGGASIESVPDARGVTLYIHYSISRLPETGYQPRLADDRVGHFMTVIKDYSKTGQDDQFVRYINRWDLRKVEPTAKVSPPQKPIIFWIENTVPYRFRGAVREGILEWNKAFERAGFANAIEVRQQPDDATWDPEDINYNTFRWITSDAGFAMGPSRVNPLTGQILDADIIFDASFIEHWTRAFDLEKPGGAGGQPARWQRCPVWRACWSGRAGTSALPARTTTAACASTRRGWPSKWRWARMAMAAGGKFPTKEQIEKFLVEGVKSVVIHEVGHTLGLRHNFKASALWTMDELNNPEKTRDVGLAASVMDYLPVNISPKGKKQGDYFSLVPGPYDYWAIEYAYKPLPGGTEGEVAELRKIASRCTEPALDYATDEDAHGTAPDPLVNLHDLSKDPIEFARWRVELIGQLLPDLVDRMVEPGEGYQRARLAFGILLGEHVRAMGYVAHFIGGVYVHRDHKGDPDARPPLVVTEPKKQREALAMLEQQVFGPEAYQVPTELYNYLAPPHWTPVGHERAVAAGLSRPRDGAGHAGPRAGPSPLAGRAGAALGLGVEGPGQAGRLHGGGIAPAAYRGHLPRDGETPGGEVHRPHAGHQQPPPQPPAALFPAAGRSGDGQRRRAGRLRDGGRGRIAVPGRPHQGRAGRQGPTRRLHPRPSERAGRPHPQGARRPAGTEAAVAGLSVLTAAPHPLLDRLGNPIAVAFEKPGTGDVRLVPVIRITFGAFTIQRLAQGSQVLKIPRPDFAPRHAEFVEEGRDGQRRVLRAS